MAWRVNPLSQTGFKVSPVKMGEKLLWGGSGPLSSSPFSSSCIPSDTILNTWAWGISMEMWAGAMIYIRSPSCIAISWSYLGSKFWLLWKSHHTPFFHFASFCFSHLISFFKKMQLIQFLFLVIRPIIPTHLKRHNFFSFTSARLSTRLYAWLSAGLSARLSTQLSAWFLMLPNLTNHYIKLSDGDLQCEWNSDNFHMRIYWVKDLPCIWVEKILNLILPYLRNSCVNSFVPHKILCMSKYLWRNENKTTKVRTLV